ncbi:MAG: hypothetical protein Ct9H300mP29_2970 [Candidatus Neomarinimicrobiota bacterium]|nr:MAG: hypothetical protein Ct9H300mP29_2970 [Candidatus Neomarinimicrobiota bacterium]
MGFKRVFFDGDLDGGRFVCTNYVEYMLIKILGGDQHSGRRAYCDPDVFKGISDKFFHNNGDGTFTDWTDKSGIKKNQGKGLGVVPGDYDNDGDMDFYVPMIK